jgi:hypothetical protein
MLDARSDIGGPNWSSQRPDPGSVSPGNGSRRRAPSPGHHRCFMRVTGRISSYFAVSSVQPGASPSFLDSLILLLFPQVSGSVPGPGAYDLTAWRPAVQAEDLVQLPLVSAEFCGASCATCCSASHATSSSRPDRCSLVPSRPIPDEVLRGRAQPLPCRLESTTHICCDPCGSLATAMHPAVTGQLRKAASSSGTAGAIGAPAISRSARNDGSLRSWRPRGCRLDGAIACRLACPRPTLPSAKAAARTIRGGRPGQRPGVSRGPDSAARGRPCLQWHSTDARRQER